MKRLLHMSGVLPALWAASCASLPGPPPLLSVGDRPCDAQPVLDGAAQVPLDAPRGVEVKLDAASRCLRPQGSREGTTYAVLRLPQALASRELTIRSLARRTLVRPRATVLSDTGTPLLTLGPDAFRERNSDLSVEIPLNGTERWLVVEADRAKLGQSFQFFLDFSSREGVLVASQNFIYIPPMYKHSGLDRYYASAALNGVLRVIVAPPP